MSGSLQIEASRHPLLAGALAESCSSGRTVIDLSACTPVSLNGEGEAALISAALAALTEAGRPLTSLTLLGLSEPLRLPEPATLAFLCSCGLSELQLSDVSAKRAEADGAANLLRWAPPVSSWSDSDCEGGGPVVSLADSIRARGSAMLRFAAAVPQLKRLTACSAAFPATDVSALAALTGLEELSLCGAMECAPAPGSTPARGGPCGRSLDPSGRQVPAVLASAVYQSLLAALPRLRRLALPMALVSQQPSATADGTPRGAPAVPSSLYDSSDDEDCGPDLGLSSGYASDAGASSVYWSWGSLAGGGGSGGLAGARLGISASPASTATGFGPCNPPDARGGLAAVQRPLFLPLPLLPSLHSCGSMALSPTSTGAAASFSVGGDDSTVSAAATPTNATKTRTAAPRSPLEEDSSAAELSTAAAVQTPGSGAAPSASASARSGPAWRFPPGLEELTLPLCALNAPLFHALCCEYGNDRSEHGSVCGTEASYGDAADGTSPLYAGLKALHVTCAPGYTSWEGSFLKTEADFAALSRLTGLETLHLAFELGAPGGSRREALLRAAFARLRALPNIRDLRISETRLPLCFSVRKPRTSAPPPSLADLLETRAPGITSTAPSSRVPPDGGALTPARVIFPMAPPLPLIPQLGGLPARPPIGERANPELLNFGAWSSFATLPAGSQAVTTPTHSRGGRADGPRAALNATPRPFPSPPPLASAFWLPQQQAHSPLSVPLTQAAAALEREPQSSGSREPPCRPSAAALQPLLSSWPRLQRLTFFGQAVVRVPGPAGAGGDRLLFPTSVQELVGCV